MVCDRCKMAVTSELEKQKIDFQNVELGEVTLKEPANQEQMEAFRMEIERLGFELIDDKKAKIIERIKAEVIRTIRQPSVKIKSNFSTYLAEKIGRDYSSLSSLFSEVEGTTIEHYTIRQKIERVKELLMYNELSLKEIASQLRYSSVSHLSNQFRKVTGLTPSLFKKGRHKLRTPLDKI